jgi:hypothetical protein
VYHWLIQSRFGPAALVALVAGVIITLLLATRPESAPAPPPRAKSEPDRAAVSAVEEPAMTPPPQREAVAQPLQPRVPHTKGPDQASGVNQRVRRVTIQVLPVDAKVVYRGVKRPGPPYEVDVPIGKKIALEVVRKGFVTRRLVIDGSEAKVSVALVAERHNKTTRPEQQDHEELAEPRDEPPATEQADDGLTDEAPLSSEPVGRHAAP